MSPVRQTISSRKFHNLMDPQGARHYEELRRQAVQDATKATDAVRAKLRDDLRSSRNKT